MTQSVSVYCSLQMTAHSPCLLNVNKGLGSSRWGHLEDHAPLCMLQQWGPGGVTWGKQLMLVHRGQLGGFFLAADWRLSFNLIDSDMYQLMMWLKIDLHHRNFFLNSLFQERQRHTIPIIEQSISNTAERSIQVVYITLMHTTSTNEQGELIVY